MTNKLKLENPPSSDKAGLMNLVRMMYNFTQEENITDAEKVTELRYQLQDLLDSLSAARVGFTWTQDEDAMARAYRQAEDMRRMVAQFAMENPNMVD